MTFILQFQNFENFILENFACTYKFRLFEARYNRTRRAASMSGVVYFKLRSALESHHIRFDGVFLSVSELKESIRCQLGLDRDYKSDILLSNAKTGEGVIRP